MNVSHHHRRAAFEAFVCLAALLLAAPAGSQPIGAPGSADGPVVWGQEVFAIPYQWGGKTDPSRARRVVLYLSRDAGRNWSQVAEAEPRVQSFTYRATGDGDYWFAVRTIDSAGAAWPSGPLAPELHVAVDTRIPTISSLSAAIAPDGRLTAGCLIQDAHIDASAIRLSVQDGAGWRDLATRHTLSNDGATLVVRATGQLPAGTPRASVRVAATDRAGNPAQAGVAATRGAAVAGPVSPPPTTHAARPFGFASQPLAASPSAIGNNPASPGARDPFLVQTPSFGAPSSGNPSSGNPSPGPAAAPAPYPSTSYPPSVFAPGQRRVEQPPADQTHGPAGTPWQSSGQQRAAAGPAGRSTSNSDSTTWSPDGFSRTPYRGEARPLTPVPSPTPKLNAYVAPPSGVPNPPDSVYRSSGPRSSFASLSPAASSLGPAPFPGSPAPPRDLAAAPPSFRTTPLPEQAQHVGSQRFELDYDVAAAGRWGVERVTLWGTRDRGKTWRMFAIDSDNRSPLDVAVDGEGLYGFRVTVEGVGGLTPEGPQPGDAPEVWVEVDRTEPEVRLTAAHQGEGYFGDHLVIHWQADDANLGPRPITLSYAARPNGPWAPMASSIENTGRYAWRLQRHLPSRLYLRVEAEDAAGNVGTAATPQPLAIDLPAPEATVRSVRPIGR